VAIRQTERTSPSPGDHRHDALGAWIRQARLRQHFSQRELAERAGMSRSYLCDIERGRGATPSMAALDRLALALGVARTDLLQVAGVIEQPVGSGADAGERRLLALYRDLTAEGQGTVERFTRFLHHEEHRFVQPALVEPESDEQMPPSGPTLFDLSRLRELPRDR
jgi:transcriptional regulator with XRE-family HTH domain